MHAAPSPGPGRQPAVAAPDPPAATPPVVEQSASDEHGRKGKDEQKEKDKGNGKDKGAEGGGTSGDG